MAIPSAVANLPREKQDALLTHVKPKFDAYFFFTSHPGAPPRSVPDPHGQPWFIYPVQTMIPDLTFLWSLFSDVYQIVGGPDQLADLVHADAQLHQDISRIIEGSSPTEADGSFWHFPQGRIPHANAIGTELSCVLRTLRNSFSHSHWLCADLSALDYWRALGWDTLSAPPSCDLLSRPAKNFMMYIADSTIRAWDGERFWILPDLRIISTPAHILRYHLHLFVDYVLTGNRIDVFGNG